MHLRRRLWKTTKVVALSVLGIGVLSIGGGGVYRAYRQHALTAATAIDGTRGVDEALFTTIGGIDQWIGIRGQNRDNPVLLVLHGGPGFAMSPMPRSFLFSWTRDFTVVLWDQRGAGRTFGRSGPVAADVTKDRVPTCSSRMSAQARASIKASTGGWPTHNYWPRHAHDRIARRFESSRPTVHRRTIRYPGRPCTRSGPIDMSRDSQRGVA